MIIANITTYRGQCFDAIHYYCKYEIVNDVESPRSEYVSESYSGRTDLKRVIITESETQSFNKKDTWSGWHVGDKTSRFDTIEQVHGKLIELYPNEVIVSYYDGHLFKEMLYYKSGVNLGYKAFGEQWSYVPNSCWKDLLPEDLNSIIIKCDDCGHEYKLNEISKNVIHDELNDKGENRILLKFYRKNEMDEVCCKWFNLKWNVIL